MWQNYYGKRVLPRRTLWQDMHNLQRNMDYIFGGTRGPIWTKFPPINAWVDNEAVNANIEIPGSEPENIDITVVGKVLTVSGEIAEEELPDGAKYHRRERSVGKFSRTLELPFEIDVDAVEATFQNGILQLHLPRIPEEQPKKITVSVA